MFGKGTWGLLDTLTRYVYHQRGKDQHCSTDDNPGLTCGSRYRSASLTFTCPKCRVVHKCLPAYTDSHNATTPTRLVTADPTVACMYERSRRTRPPAPRACVRKGGQSVPGVVDRPEVLRRGPPELKLCIPPMSQS